MTDWARPFGLTRQTTIRSARVTVASMASLLVARSLKLQEFYWAPISTIVILLSTIDPLTLGWQRFIGTAIGAAAGAAIASLPHHGWLIYGLGVFLCGILCALFRVSLAYRFAAITLSIVVLIPYNRPPWNLALYRFIEVSLGIAVALLIAIVWPIAADQVR